MRKNYLYVATIVICLCFSGCGVIAPLLPQSEDHVSTTVTFKGHSEEYLASAILATAENEGYTVASQQTLPGKGIQLMLTHTSSMAIGVLTGGVEVTQIGIGVQGETVGLNADTSKNYGSAHSAVMSSLKSFVKDLRNTVADPEKVQQFQSQHNVTIN